MHLHRLTRVLPYAPDQLFALVGDVEHYPAFVPWVTSMRVSNLRAESFVDALPAGAAESLRIQTAFDDGKKQETVVVHQAGPDYYAVRQGDAGAAKLIAPAILELVAALDASQK